MAKRTANQNAIPATQVVQIPLMPEIVEKLLSLKVSTEQLLEQFDPVLQEGYSLTITFDPSDGKYTARLAGISKMTANAGKLLYANGSTLRLTLLALYGKHFLVSKDGIWESTLSTSSEMS